MARSIEVHNGLSHIRGDRKWIRELDELTSYPIKGAEFAPSYRTGMWDGREHLLRKSRRGDFYLLPTGVLGELDLSGIELIDNRRKAGERLDIGWSGHSLREYQENAVAAALDDRGPFTARGMLNLPIRSGKTVIAAKLIQVLGVRTLFVVPSDLLLKQTYKSLGDTLGKELVGMVGGGHRNPSWITVATAQSLLKHKKLAADLLSTADLLLADECHHYENESWRNLILKGDSPFKIGLSATIFVSRLKQNDKSSIWLKACTGPILYRASMSSLIKAGHIVQPKVFFYEYKHPVSGNRWNWHRVARELLALNKSRNTLIANLALGCNQRGKSVLIDTGRRDQMKLITYLLAERGLSVEVVHGQTSSSRRWEIINAFREKKIDVVVGTVFGEGVDIPELEVVINAEAQKSPIAAIQRMRNLTPHPGKTEGWFIDIYDRGQKWLEGHAEARMKLYKGTRGFIVETCKYGSPNKDPLGPKAS